MIGTGDFRKKAEPKVEVKPHVLPAAVKAKKAKTVAKAPKTVKKAEYPGLGVLFNINARLLSSGPLATQEAIDLQKVEGEIANIVRNYLNTHPNLDAAEVRAVGGWLASVSFDTVSEHILFTRDQTK